MFFLLDPSELRSDDSNRLFAPQNNAHVKGTDTNQQNWKHIRQQKYQNVVAENKKTRPVKTGFMVAIGKHS